jgi:hypothetical protein
MTTFHCVGIGSNVDGMNTGLSYCETSDKDGDKYLTRNANQGPKGTQEAVVGTGKYEGMVRSRHQ